MITILNSQENESLSFESSEVLTKKKLFLIGWSKGMTIEEIKEVEDKEKDIVLLL